MKYRKGTLDDVGQMKDLALESWAQYEKVLTQENWLTLSRNLAQEKVYADLVRKSESIVCENEGEIVGMAFLVPSGNPSEIYDSESCQIRFVTVSPRMRGRKIGEYLTKRCMEIAKENGEKKIALHTSEIMNSARHIYKKLGFRVLRELDEIYGVRYWLYGCEVREKSYEVVAGVILDDKKVLIAKRGIGKKHEGLWEFPGGKIEQNETQSQALVRELREELAIKIEVLSKFHENSVKTKDQRITLHSFLVKHISGEIKLSAHSEYKWVNIADLLYYDFPPADHPIVTKLVQKFTLKRAYYSNPITKFLTESDSKILGELVISHTNKSLDELQRNAWTEQILILKEQLKQFEGFIFFEFAIPRMGKRVDNVIIIDDQIFIIEFKVGEKIFKGYDKEQVIDYKLDLENFHEGSHNQNLIPVLIATEADDKENEDIIYCNRKNLGLKLSQKLNRSAPKINPISWSDSIYKPTPTIIEAAQALYKGHNVLEISRSDAGAINLSKTTNCLNSIIENSKNQSQKSICFVTGVPGAGKTLAGLNIANERMKSDETEHAVFLSGNGPLVDVLREALTRDLVNSKKEIGEPITKKNAKRKTQSFIQNIHHFRDDNLKDTSPPTEKVVIFDEAQRAWNQEQTSSFMKRKKGLTNFDKSEPEFLIEVMDRHQDWCTIICLIGGGQEINTGEAGLEEWLFALKNKFTNWQFHYSNQILTNPNYIKDLEIKSWLSNKNNIQNDLHLSVSVRSFRSEKLAQLVKEILDLELGKAQNTYKSLKEVFPIRITRDFETAKKWTKQKARGTERYGVIASSGARRLKPLGINVRNEIDACNWFLNDNSDVRSSYYFEDVATEFEIQGLEIDWACIAWGANFYLHDNQWQYQSFKGSKWMQMHKLDTREFVKNTYRVLMTRSRQGFIIFIPEGSDSDITRPKLYYDETYKYLKEIGIEEI